MLTPTPLLYTLTRHAERLSIDHEES